jgi:hypothetical protein
MTQFTPAMDAALAGVAPTIFGAIEIVFPEHTLRLLTGSAQISFGGRTFTGSDPTYGVLSTDEDMTDGTGDQAPELRFTFIPTGDAATADLAAAHHQGSPVSVWLGVVDPASGQAVPDPLLIFYGMVDVPTIQVDRNTRTLEITVVSGFEYFFTNDDGARLSDAFHQSIWPGETGLNQVTGIMQHLYWGSSAPSGVSR